jgi:hypothetical protein
MWKGQQEAFFVPTRSIKTHDREHPSSIETNTVTAAWIPQSHVFIEKLQTVSKWREMRIFAAFLFPIRDNHMSSSA